MNLGQRGKLSLGQDVELVSSKALNHLSSVCLLFYLKKKIIVNAREILES